jgi:hypothetical protein
MPDFSTILQSPDIRALVQENILERAFHDALFPRLLFRGDASPQIWPANIGDTMVFTGVGLMKPSLRALAPGNDPTVADYQKEQWTAQIQQYASTIDTHMPTSIVAIANLFLRNAHQLGLMAGQSLNRLVRNAMYRAALSGQTVVDGAQLLGTTLRVARLNGFTRARNPGLPLGSAVRFDLVSGNNPLTISVVIGGVPTPTTVIGFTADNAGDEVGPGVLLLGTAVGPTIGREPVLAADKSFIVRVGGAQSIDGITSVNQIRLTDIRTAVSRFWQENVPEHPDGRFHCHLDPFSQAEVFNDPEWQRLLTALPDYFMYQQFAIGQMLGCAFFRNSECPIPETVDTAPTSFVSPATNFSLDDPFPGELFNATNVGIHRALFSGQGGIMEYYQDLSALLTEAGVTGKVGEPRINNNGIEVFTDRIQLILRAPLNRLQDTVATSWKFIGDWPVRTDATSGDQARYKRFITVEHA